MTSNWKLGPGGYPMNVDTNELMEWQEAVDYINQLEARIARFEEMTQPFPGPYTKAVFIAGEEGTQQQ